MKRETEELARSEFDVLIIGGGILGLFIARDAARRGLSVALVERGDFGGETSSNSLRIIHGGYRYLQSLDISKTRKYIREQRIFMNMAPHLVRPMPVVVPFYDSNFVIKSALKASLKLYEILGKGLGVPEPDSCHGMQNGIIGAAECEEAFPWIRKKDLAFGLRFTDCQMTDSERFSLQVAASAFGDGARLANYVQATGLIIKDNKVLGVTAKDLAGGGDFEIRAGITVNSSGPWLNSLLYECGSISPVLRTGNVRAFNLLLNKALNASYALGLKNRISESGTRDLFSRESRYLFVTPWNGRSLIGTQYLSVDDEPVDFKVSGEQITQFLDDINTGSDQLTLKTEDVEHVYSGYIPTYRDNDGKHKIGVLNSIYDHQSLDGTDGLISARGSKYTESRLIAERVTDLVITKTGGSHRVSDAGPVNAAEGKRFDYEQFIARESEKNSGMLSPDMTRRLILTYGLSYKDSLQYTGNNENRPNMELPEQSVTRSRIIHAVRNEMALTLGDLVFRRLGLNHEEIKANLADYAILMGEEMDWDMERIKSEKKEVLARLEYSG